MDEHLTAESGDVLLAIGTMKGVWLFRSDPDRQAWQSSGPHFPGEAVYAVRFDGRGGRRRLLAGTEDGHWGAVVRCSDDLGRTWSDPAEGNVRFPQGTDAALRRVWQLQPAGPDRPDTVFAGVEPAALFRSDDRGETFELVTGLWDHPHRPRWEPGGGGLCLHTVVVDQADPERMWVAISTGGVYRSDDGGRTWQARNHGVRAEFRPDKHPEFGQCVHKIAPAAGRPERLYLQNHWGLYRSDDAAPPGAPVPPEPLGPVPQRRRRRELGGRRQRRAERLRLPGGRPPDRPGYRLGDPAGVRPVPSHPRRHGPGVPHPRRRRLLGAAR